MFGLLLSRRSDEEKRIADSIRAMKTVRVSGRGGVSIDSLEILRNEQFIKASQRAKRLVADG